VQGPLVVKWPRSIARLEPHAGCLTEAAVGLENAGSAVWRPDRVKLAYHWLDDKGNPIVWDGLRTELGRTVAPGETVELRAAVRGPIPPGPYRLAFDLVEEGRFWFSEVGNARLEQKLVVLPRDASSAVAHLDGVEPSADWHALVRAAHERGYGAVGGAIEAGRGRFRRAPQELGPYAPGGGRNPAFGAPLVCPSLLPPLEPNTTVAGLPAWLPEGDEPWVYDGRITARLPADRRRG
jgi:hypothetical protein